MNLRRLRAFLAVADELIFRRAGARVAVTQPALSQQIRELEEELDGVALFERDKRHVALTEAGRVLLDPAREALTRLDGAFAEVRRFGSAAARTLRLGYVEYMNLPFLAPALRRLSEASPEIVVEPNELHSAGVLAALAEKALDLGFAFLPVAHPDLAARGLLVGNWMLVLAEAHPHARREVVPVAALETERLVLWARHLNPPLYDSLLAAMSAGMAGAEPNVVYRTAQAHLGPSLVAEGIGLFVIASYILRELPPGLVSRPLAGFDNRLPLAAVWRGDGRTPAVRAFLDALDDVWDGKAGEPR